MRNYLTILAIYFSSSILFGQTNDLVSLLHPTGKCNKVTSKAYTIKNGFCSTTIFLDSDSTFTYETGCEGRSRVSIGKWSVVGDSVVLKPFGKLNIKPVCNVEVISSGKNDSTVTFIIKDKLGSSTNDILKPICLNNDEQEKATWQILFNHWKDSLTIQTTSIDSFSFPRLTLLTGENFTFSAKDLPSTVMITLNLNSAAVGYDEITYISDLKATSWFIKKGKLIRGTTILELYK